MSENGYGTQTLDGCLAALGSDAPTPGGGSGAAVTGALGASLVRMLAALTIGRKKYAEHEDLMKAIAAKGAKQEAIFQDLAETAT